MYLAAGVGAARPVHADAARDVELCFQLLHDVHCPLLRLDERDAAELGAGAGHQPPAQRRRLDEVLLEQRLLRFRSLGSVLRVATA